MTGRVLWIVCLPLALAMWAGLVLFTRDMPPNQFAYFVFLPLLGVATSFTVAPLVWWLARRLHLPGPGQRPVLALRAAGWVGVWVAVCAGLKLNGIFDWVTAATLAIVLALLESFVLQLAPQDTGKKP